MITDIEGQRDLKSYTGDFEGTERDRRGGNEGDLLEVGKGKPTDLTSKASGQSATPQTP